MNKTKEYIKRQNIQNIKFNWLHSNKSRNLTQKKYKEWTKKRLNKFLYCKMLRNKQVFYTLKPENYITLYKDWKGFYLHLIGEAEPFEYKLEDFTTELDKKVYVIVRYLRPFNSLEDQLYALKYIPYNEFYRGCTKEGIPKFTYEGVKLLGKHQWYKLYEEQQKQFNP